MTIDKAKHMGPARQFLMNNAIMRDLYAGCAELLVEAVAEVPEQRERLQRVYVGLNELAERADDAHGRTQQ